MRILDFGSLNIDHVYRVPHLVREGETLDSLAYERNEGGKGLNQAVALAQAGAQVHLAGAVGEDGRFLLDFAGGFGVDTRHVQVVPGPTGHALIQVDREGHNAIVLHGGANQGITPDMVDRVLAHFGPGDLLLVQNEASGLPHLLQAAHARGLAIALNPSPMTQALKEGPLDLVNWLLLNRVEGYDMTGQEEVEAILAALLAQYPRCRIVLTLGKEGALCADREGRLFQRAIPVETVDSTAAGDTFTGYFLHTVCSGGSVAQALLRAAQAASLAVGRPGAGRSIPSRQEVDRALNS